MITFSRTSSFSKGRAIGLLAALGVLGLHGVTPLAGMGTARAQVAWAPEQYGSAYWPFEGIADRAAGTAGFSPDARQSVKWSAAIFNAYTGDQGWLREAPAVPVQGSPAGFQNRPAGGAQRTVASQATRDFILSLRFDRARTIYDADAAWRRVMSGALAGLLYARERSDVAAAHNVVGAALYASQNFYTHTNWIDHSPRRLTYFETPGVDRQNVPLSSDGVNPNPEVARALAERQCVQTLQVLEYAMNRAGAAEFWKKVKADGTTQADRERQFEEFGRMPHAFLSAGTNAAPAGETWLRVRLKTSNEANSGTNARMVLKGGGRETVLDWLPTVTNVGSPYDDFEAGNDDAYWVGPFAAPPTELQISNEAMDGRVTIPLMPAFVIWNALVLVLKPLDMVFSNPPDFVQNGESRWSVPDVRALPGGAQPFSVDLDGKDEGHYKVHGTIERTGEDATYYYARIRLNRLDCVTESKIDGLSSSDEPFLMVTVASMGANPQYWRTEPFSDVDKGETRPLDAAWENVKIHKLAGGISVGIKCWESDQETKDTRDKMMVQFESKMDELFHSEWDKLLALLPMAVSESFSTDWKLEQMEVTAFTRGGGMQKFGTLYSGTPNRWVKARESASFALAGSASFRELGITSEEMLKLPAGTGAGTGAGNAGADRPTVKQDLSAWEGEWETTLGTIKLTKAADDRLTGTVVRTLENGLTREGETVEVSYGGKMGQAYGKWGIGGGYARSGILTWDLAGDKNSFKGTYEIDGQPAPLTPYEWSGKRRAGANAPVSKYDLSKWVGDWYTDTGKLSLKASETGLQGTLYYLRRDTYSIEGGRVTLTAGDRPGHIKGDYRYDSGLGQMKQGTMEICLSEDSSAFLATLTDGPGTDPYEWLGSRSKRSAAATKDLGRWAGDWKLGAMELTFRPGTDGVLHGRPKGSADDTSAPDFLVLLPGPNSGSTLGRLVTGSGKTRGKFLEWDLAGDGSRFTGTISSIAPGSVVVANGTRIGTAPAPAPTTTANGGGAAGSPISGGSAVPGNTGIVPPTGGSTTAPVTASAGDLLGDGQFRHLTDVDVRLDKLSPGRGNTIQAFFTFKNTSKKSTRIMGGTLDLWLFDAEGIGWSDRGTLYRASGTTLENAGILDVEPGDEVKIRYVWDAPGGLRALKSLRMQDRSQFEKNPVLWDLQSYLPKGADESILPSGLSTAGDGEFAEMGDWDLRLDGVKRTGTKVELQFTFRNSGTTPKVFSGGFRPTLTDTDGASAYTTGQFFRATGAREEFKTSLVAAPNGGEARVSYYLTLPSPNAGPNKLTVNWFSDKKSYDLSGIR